MSMTNAAEQAFLDLLFLNADWTDIGDAAGQVLLIPFVSHVCSCFFALSILALTHRQ